ncbi:hypothetical protein ACTJKO_05865 [Curtobacterium sp. 22159]|uniref:hypothetical protein n=1 Tax=Curtobacterium sp. 22159 TaxID=3453882 RepID=UPI003F85AB88
MDPDAFDGVAAIGLLLLLPVSVLFAAAALRRLGIPRWAWALYLLGVAGVLVLLHLAGSVWYTIIGAQPDILPWWGFGQIVGLALGRIGVVVNAVAAAAWIVLRKPASAEPLPRRETFLVVSTYGTMAVGCALPAAWWGLGLGVVPLSVEAPVVVAGAGFLATALVLRGRRARTAADDGRPSQTGTWPVDAAVSVWLVGALAVGPLFTGSGLPDGSLLEEHRVDGRSTQHPVPSPEDWPGPTPTTTTSLDAASIESGTRTMLEDTIRWAGPLDDLGSPTPARADPPAVVLVEEACEDGRGRWSGSLVLPTTRPQDLAPRVLAGWEAAGYAAVDRAMGVDLVMPVRGDAAVARMRLGGGADGVHVDVESFCVDR